MSETSGKNAIELAKEGITAIGSVVKTAKLYPKKSRRLNDRIQPLNDFLSSVNSAKGGADRNISLLTFLIKEVHTFLARFTDSQYLLKSWNANIDLERFHDLTQQVYEFSQTFAVAGGKFDPQAIALEDAQDKKDDDLHHKKVLEGLNPDNAVSVRAGLEGLEAKVVDPLPSSKPKIDEIRTKIHQIETDFENYQDYLIEDLDLASLECDRTHVNKIGEGKFGIVFKGQLLGEEVAVKYLREAVFSAEKQVAIRKEIAKLQLLKHENIVRYFGAQTKTTPYFFVLEKQFCSLYSALYASDENRKLDLGKTNYRRKLEILIDCGRAVEYLHSVNVVYRNIKSTNILVTSAGRAKISDFSYAMNKQDLNFSLSGGSVRASITGSGAVLSAQKVFPAYLAPEIILNANKDPIGYNIHTDAYAFGILINEVLTHTPPFPGLTFRNIMSKLQKSDNNRPLLFAHNYNALHQGNALYLELRSLIERAWSTNPTNRPSFTHITLILERILQVVDDLTAVSVEISDKSPIPSYDETSLSKSVSFTARKSFYQKGVSDNNSSLYEMGNDPNDLSMSRDAGDYSPVKTNKIATIIETYEKGFTTATERSFDRSFERSADFGDANSHPAVFVKIYDKFEKSMDKPNDAMDKSRSIDRTRSQDRMSLSKSGSVERRSLYGVFEPTLEVDSVGSADRSDIVSINPSSADQNKAATSEVTKETAALDLTAIGIAMEHSVSGDSKITDPSLMISKSTDSAAVVLTSPGGSTNVASGTRSFLEVNHSRTFDSYDSNAPPAVTVVKSTSQNAFDIGTEGLKATRTNDSMDYIGAQSTESVNDDDPDYAHSKYIAQLFYDAGSCGKKESQAKLEELAAQNDLLALGFLMGMLCYGSGMSKDVKKANEIAKRIYSLIIQRADDENDSSRKFYQYIAGLCYEQGVGAEKNDILAVKYYQLSADQGYAAALSNLGYCYKHGQGVKEDRYEAVRLYGLGADQNHATSLNNLGYCYQHGYGVQKDLQEAVRLYKRSADQGHSTAQNNLGYCYQYGQGCDKNLAEAVRLYELSAGQGCSFGQNSLGHCYKRGHGVPKDYAKAVYYYRLSAEQGHATAQNNLGYCYQYGQGADVNYAEAVRWYKLSVEQGQASAENNLGFCYQCGIGVKKDLSEAVRLYKSSSEKGYAVAMYNLGLCYLNGMGVPNDPDKAVQLIRSSAEQGHTAGQVKLAMCYEEGVGVAKDTREAIRWYVMAARRGDETAMKALKRIHG